MEFYFELYGCGAHYYKVLLLVLHAYFQSFFLGGGGVCLHLKPPPLGTSLQPLLRSDVKGCHFLGCHFGDPQRRTKEMKNLSQLKPCRE